jgi:anoctamin-10
MMFPAAFGFSCWILLPQFSAIYAIVNGLWCVVFVEWWKRQEFELAFRWGVRGVSAIEDKRREFQYEKEVHDPITGETTRYFPATKRLYRQLLQVPFALVASIALGSLIAICFGIEIFISEVYNGPLKSVLTFLPTILLTTLVPTISKFLTGLATRLTDFENYATQDSYDRAMVSKLFVLNFITSYLGICLTAFVYVPFAAILVPYLDIFSLTVAPFATDDKQMQAPHPANFTINPNRLRNQVIYFSVTAQIVNFALETVMPLVMQKGTAKYKEMQASRAEKKGGAAPPVSANDPPEEKEFLNRVREEAALPEYDVQTDLREMVIQFGYLSLFSVVWPVVPVCFFINNWVELRGDIFKLTKECKRPNPQRADTIGPWLDSLGFLAWLGSLTSAAIVYMFSNNGLGPDGRPSHVKFWALLLTVFFSEHLYLVVRLGVRTIIGKLDSENKRKEREERFMVRKRYLEEAGLGDVVRGGITSPPMSPLASKNPMQEQITRQSLEEDAREASLHDSTPSSRFWNRQKGWAETEKTGLRLIDTMTEGENETKKTM